MTVTIDPTLENMIKTVLNIAGLSYTSTEIYEILKSINEKTGKHPKPFEKTSIRTYLLDMTNTNQISGTKEDGKKFLQYQPNKATELKNFEVEVQGLWLHHPDKDFVMDCVKNRPSEFGIVPKGTDDLELSENDEKILQDTKALNEVKYFEGVGLMDLNYVCHIAGVQQYRKYLGKTEGVAQRPKNKDWIFSLKNGLGKKRSAMFNATILFFDQKNIEVETLEDNRGNGLSKWKLKIPYYEHAPDTEKPGLIIDGQQRMWALDYLKIERKLMYNMDTMPFYGPITIIVGDFGEHPEFRISLIRMFFILANSAKNLPKGLKDDLSSELKGELKDTLDLKLQIEGLYRSYVDDLASNTYSPFYDIVNYNAKAFNIEYSKEEGYSQGALLTLVKNALEEYPPFFKPNDLKTQDSELSELRNNQKKWVSFLIDYFNAIRCVFKDEWDDPNSIIHLNVVICALSRLGHLIWEPSFLKYPQSEQRVEKLIEKFVIWKSMSENLDLSAKSEFISGDILKPLVNNIDKVTEKLFVDLTEVLETSETADITMIDSAKAVWNKLKADAQVAFQEREEPEAKDD